MAPWPATSRTHAAARPLLEESLAIRREIGDRLGIGETLINLGEVELSDGNLDNARRFYEESLAVLNDVGEIKGVAMSLEGIADVDSRGAEPDRAIVIWAAAHALRERVGCPLAPREHARLDDRLAATRAAVPQADFEVAWAAGGAMSLEQAVGYARSPRQ